MSDRKLIQPDDIKLTWQRRDENGHDEYLVEVGLGRNIGHLNLIRPIPEADARNIRDTILWHQDVVERIKTHIRDNETYMTSLTDRILKLKNTSKLQPELMSDFYQRHIDNITRIYYNFQLENSVLIALLNDD